MCTKDCLSTKTVGTNPTLKSLKLIPIDMKVIIEILQWSGIRKIITQIQGKDQ